MLELPVVAVKIVSSLEDARICGRSSQAFDKSTRPLQSRTSVGAGNQTAILPAKHRSRHNDRLAVRTLCFIFVSPKVSRVIQSF